MLVLPVFAAFATSLMVARVDLLIADFPKFGDNTLTRKSTMASASCRIRRCHYPAQNVTGAGLK